MGSLNFDDIDFDTTRDFDASALFHNWYFKFNIPVLTQNSNFEIKYCKVASSNTSRLEAHAGFFRLLMKGFSMLMYCDLFLN